MSNHNQLRGQRHAEETGSHRTHGKHRNNQPQQGFRMEIPKALEKEVRQADAHCPRITLTGFGGRHYGSVGRLLVARHKDSTITLLQTVIPFRENRVDVEVTLRPQDLEFAGDVHEVISVYRYRGIGVWFVSELATTYQGGVEEEPGYQEVAGDFMPLRRVHSDFPIVTRHPEGDTQRGETLMRRINMFTGLDIRLNTMRRYRDYRAWPLAKFMEMYPELATDRAVAVKVLPKKDITALDELAHGVQNIAGFHANMETGSTEVLDEATVNEANTLVDKPAEGRVETHRAVTAPMRVSPKKEPIIIRKRHLAAVAA